MKIAFILAITAFAAAAQTPTVKMINTSRPGSPDFQIGDRFQVVVTGAPNLPVSVRTINNFGRMDWSPVIGFTDTSGRWSVSGQFDRDDIGLWREMWTVGGRLTDPAAVFSVGLCVHGWERGALDSGLRLMVNCETNQPPEARFEPHPFRTPDGRIVPGHLWLDMTTEQAHMEIAQSLMRSTTNDGYSIGEPGDNAAVLITKMIGANALGDAEVQIVVDIIRAAFRNPERIPSEERQPRASVNLLRRLEEQTDQPGLKQQLKDTISFVQAQSG